MLESKKVLVVDDSKDLLKLMKIFIEQFGEAQALTLKSFEEIQNFEEKALGCDLAFLDINLGEGQPDGIYVYHWLRERGFEKPIYFLTGHAKAYPLVSQAEKLGDAIVLNKPIAPEELQNIILQNFHAQQTNF